MFIDLFFLIYEFKLSDIQTVNLRLLMQPVGTAVSVVCVRSTVISFKSQYLFYYTGETKSIYGECSITLSNDHKVPSKRNTA